MEDDRQHQRPRRSRAGDDRRGAAPGLGGEGGGAGCRGRAGRWRRGRGGRGRRRLRRGRWCGRWRGGRSAAGRRAGRARSRGAAASARGSQPSGAEPGEHAARAAQPARSWRSAPVWARSSMSIIRPGPSLTSQGLAAAASCASARRRRMSAASARTLAASRGAASTAAMAAATASATAGRPGDDAGAGQREVLPGPGLLGLVAAEGGERGRDRAGPAGGAQAHVDLVEDALGHRRGQGGDQRLGQAGVVDGDGERAPAARRPRRPRRRR